MRRRHGSLGAAIAAAALAAGCSGGADGVTGPSGPPDISGRYNYTAQATTMTCSDGLTIPLPAVSDGLTIVQNGNRFSGELDIADGVALPGGASFFEDCRIENDGAYSCVGTVTDPNATIVFSGGGVFAANGFTGATDLRMTLTDGVVCTWTKQESGVRVG